MRAVREGIRPDGSLIGPPMGCGFYATMAKHDLDTVFLVLRSLPPLPSSG